MILCVRRSMRSIVQGTLVTLIVSPLAFSIACGSDEGGSEPSGTGGVYTTGGQPSGSGSVPMTTGGLPTSTGGAGGSGGSGGSGGFTSGSGGTTATGGFVPATGGDIGAGGGPEGGSGGVASGGAGGVATGGAGGVATGGVGGVATGGTAGANSGNLPPCMKSPNQVISIGDSYINWPSHTFPADLNAAAGVTYRPTYAVGGFSMASGGLGLIPPEFDQATTADPNIIAVVMDGGGNDLLIPAAGRPDCKNMTNSPTVPGCQAILTDALAAADKLVTKMVQAKVHDVVYFYYPHVPAPTLLGGSAPNAMLDYALPKVKAFCDGVAAESNNRAFCWFVDLVPVFDGHPDWFAATDIHPNPTGSKAMAKAVYDTMKAHCIAQPASSGCCAP